jgi:hypothetical protein
MSTFRTAILFLVLAAMISGQINKGIKKARPDNDEGGGYPEALIRNDTSAPAAVQIIREPTVAPDVVQGEQVVINPGESKEVYGYWMTITTQREDGARLRLCYPLKEGKYRLGVNRSVAAWDFYPTKETP